MAKKESFVVILIGSGGSVISTRDSDDYEEACRLAQNCLTTDEYKGNLFGAKKGEVYNRHHQCVFRFWYDPEEANA